MVTRYGMSEKLGPQTFGDANHEVFLGRDFSANADYSPEIAYEIDKEIARLIDEGYEKARAILTERREQLDLMATVLLERETLDKDELTALLDGTWDEYLVEHPGNPHADGETEAEAPAASAPEESPAAAPEAPPAAPPVLNS
jgi:cell division protease FtsH